jgi:outer membrane receptor protein involved in Fe transport
MFPDFVDSQSKAQFLPRVIALALLLALCLLTHAAFAQLDQGAITGTVTDAQGAAVPHAAVQITDTDTDFKLSTKSDGSGVYTFQPIKIGHYAVTVSAPGFATSTRSGLELNVGQRLQVNLQLQVGSSTQAVQVNASSQPLLQTQSAAVGQVMTTAQINNIPLNQRNYVFLAQLATGVAPSNGGRGAGNGDFNANGQRETENNFILDGVDNNSNAIDFLNGASYNVKPPPDALQEFNVQTADTSAEYGHAAGAVVNASIKSGTNQFHGDAWEYLRNNDLGEASPTEWSEGVTHPTSVLPYHQNQFGGTLGGPILRNKLFFFGDYEGNRIIENFPELTSVPTALMESQPGNFSQLLNTSLTGQSLPWQVFEPNSGGTEPLGSACGNAQNVMCASELDPVAVKLFQAAYPAPNTGPVGQTYNNYSWSQAVADTTNQFDIRVDDNLSQSDQIFGRVSWSHENKTATAPLGPIFDGGSMFDDGTFFNYTKNAEFSWNHVFTPTLDSQARFSYNNGFYDWDSQSYNNGALRSQYGLGGLPAYDPSLGNGGLPQIGVNEFVEIGPPAFQPSPERQNGYQIIDDVTKILGNHSLKFGVSFQNIRYSVYQPTDGNGYYDFSGQVTSQPGSVFNSGYGLADFLSDEMDGTALSQPSQSQLGRWYDAAYLQDDWKVNPRLTLNLGVRYDYFTAPIEVNDHQAEFIPVSGTGTAGGGVGEYILPSSQKNVVLSPTYLSVLAADHITIQYSGNRSLLNPQKTNFSPRFGASYQASERLVFRTGFGIYYDGIENLGNFVNLAENYPYDIEQNFPQPSCLPNDCPSDGIKLETGIPSGSLSAPTVTGWQPNIQTSYTMNQNLTMEYALTNHMTATIGYVGSEARHLAIVEFGDQSTELLPPGVNNQPYEPFPGLNGNVHLVTDNAIANYNSLQAKMERRFSNGLSFLASYTWSHSLDDDREPLPDNNEGGDRNTNIFGPRIDYANSPFNVDQRFTFTGTYDLPFGEGRKYLNRKDVVNELVGDWQTTLLFRTQTGFPFTVTSNTPTVNGASAFPYLITDPFKGGGSPNATNPNITCPAKVRTRANWYNPCAFADPPLASSVTTPISGAANILPYLGSPRSQISGPGYERIDMTAVKDFKTVENQYLQFRADVFNLFNTPTWGTPSNTTTSSIGGQITGNQFLGNYTPDARFFQLALKYFF